MPSANYIIVKMTRLIIYTLPTNPLIKYTTSFKTYTKIILPKIIRTPPGIITLFYELITLYYKDLINLRIPITLPLDTTTQIDLSNKITLPPHTLPIDTTPLNRYNKISYTHILSKIQIHIKISYSHRNPNKL